MANTRVLHLNEQFIVSDLVEIDGLTLEVCFWSVDY